jgi:delta-1-pyrroline-5-carboxylate synthetase
MYIDEAANLDMALKLMVDAKVDYPAACNAVEKVLVHSSWVPKKGLESIIKTLQASGVQVHAGTESLAMSEALPLAPSARHEYSAMACTVQVVESMQAAIDHIHANGSSHTEVIITDDADRAEEFLKAVDSACVFHNASSRFADGFRFGLGAEVRPTLMIHNHDPHL